MTAFGTLLPLWFVSLAYSRLTAPTSLHWSEERLLSNPMLDVAFDETTLAGAYGKSFQDQMKSILSMTVRKSRFHMDALTFAINATMNGVWRVQDNVDRQLVKDPRILSSYYGRILDAIVREQSPGINREHQSEKALASRADEFRRNFDIIYVDNIFDDWTYKNLQAEAARLWASKDIEPNCNLNGVDRLGGYVHHSQDIPIERQMTSLYSLIYGNEPLRLWMSAVTGTPVFPADFPIELREYGNSSKGMGCHADVQMYGDVMKIFETVVTLSNHGKCEVYWYDRDNVKHSVWPAPNSITIVRPNAAVHCVTDTQGGFREMLKFIMVGDYAKHENFFRYVDNRCSKENRNVRLLAKRRKERSAFLSSRDTPAAQEEL